MSSSDSTKTDRRRRAALIVALVGLLTGAAGLRLWAVGYGEPFLSIQIDEDRNVSLPLHLSPSNLEPRDPGYPRAYDYPALLWYALFALDRLAFGVGRAFGLVRTWEQFGRAFATDPIPFFLLGRTLSVAFGTATVALLYRLGRAVYSPLHGLVAAALLGGAFLHVRDSALATVDAPATFFVVLALLGVVAVCRFGRVRDAALAGCAAGLATATKYNMLLVFVAVALAHAMRERPDDRGRGLRWGSSGLLVAGLTATLVFLAVNPYLLLDWSRARGDLLWILHRARTGQVVGQDPVDMGPGWWYHLVVSLRYGMGLAALGLALAGITRAAWRTRWRRGGAEAVLLGFAACFYVIMGSGRLIFVRYMTPLLPVLCLFAAATVVEFARRLGGARGCPWLIAGLLGVTLVEPLGASLAYARIVHHADTRVVAVAFVGTLPEGSNVGTYGPSVVWRSTIPPAGRWQPTYYAKHPQQRWVDVFAALKAAGTRYLLVHTSPLDLYSPTFPELEEALQSALLVREFSPSEPGARPRPVYDRADPYYFPIGGFRGVRRPGPRIRLYRLD